MFESLLQSSTLPALAETARFAQMRHEVLVSNVANYGVPGYKTRDLSLSAFQQRLRGALDAPTTSPLARGQHLFSRHDDGGMASVSPESNGILLHDQSNVGMEQQVLEIAKNQGMHNLAVSILSHQINLLQAAISERV